MSQGLSYESFAGLINTCRATLYNWEKEHVDFLDSKRCGKDKELLFFEKTAIAGMHGKIKGYNAATLIFILKNRHGYKDVTDNEEPFPEN